MTTFQDLDVAAFEKAAGVGIEVTDEAVESAVAALVKVSRLCLCA